MNWRSKRVSSSNSGVPAAAGVYVIGRSDTLHDFEVSRTCVYVGETKDLRRRLNEHLPANETNLGLREYLPSDLASGRRQWRGSRRSSSRGGSRTRGRGRRTGGRWGNSSWCEVRGLGLRDVSPLHVAAHPESGPTVQQHLAAIRMERRRGELASWSGSEPTGRLRPRGPRGSIDGADEHRGRSTRTVALLPAWRAIRSTGEKLLAGRGAWHKGERSTVGSSPLPAPSGWPVRQSAAHVALGTAVDGPRAQGIVHP